MSYFIIIRSGKPAVRFITYVMFAFLTEWSRKAYFIASLIQTLLRIELNLLPKEEIFSFQNGENVRPGSDSVSSEVELD